MCYAEEILQVKTFACFTDSHLVITKKKKNHKKKKANQEYLTNVLHWDTFLSATIPLQWYNGGNE